MLYAKLNETTIYIVNKFFLKIFVWFNTFIYYLLSLFLFIIRFPCRMSILSLFFILEFHDVRVHFCLFLMFFFICFSLIFTHFLRRTSFVLLGEFFLRVLFVYKRRILLLMLFGWSALFLCTMHILLHLVERILLSNGLTHDGQLSSGVVSSVRIDPASAM